ncbi:hypothetical protein ACJZ2D_003022 [Fusarium nematophilum]
MSRAESIPAALWESQKDRIRSLYLDQDKTLDEVRQIMADQHGFHASKPQYIRRVTVLWKMRKNSTKEEWAQAGALLAKRKAEGKPTDLMMVNKIVPKKKLKKELKRYVGQVETTAITPAGVSQDVAVFTPPADRSQDIVVFTPPSSGPRVVTLNTLPLFRLQDQLNNLFAPIPIRHNSSLDMAVATSWTENLPPTTFPVPNNLSKALLEAAPCQTKRSGNDELSVAEMITLINKAVPQRPGYPQHQLVATSQPWIALFRHTIYLSTNGLLSGTGTDELLRLAIEIGAMAALKEAVLISSPESKMFASNLLFSAIRVQKNSDLGLFRFLLRLGVNPDSVESHPGAGQRRTALQTTICEENIRAVQLLLDFGADPNAMCKGVQGEKRSPLNLALWEPQRSSIAEVLIKAKADLTATVFMQDGEPQSPIMLAARNRDIDRIKQLIRGGADPNHLAPHGLSALHLAIRNGDQDIVEALLKGGADPNLLCESKHIDTMQEAKHQLVEERHQRWIFTLCSPIKAAASVGELPIMKSLLAAGADPDSYVDPGPYARRGYFTYDTNTALQDAIRYGLYDLAEFLLNNGAGVNVRHPSLSSPLQLACASEIPGPEKRRLVGLLLERGADVNAAPRRNKGRTALQAAVQSGDFNLAERLLRIHADVNAPAARYGGRTALQAAAESGNMGLINLLLRHGANPTAEAAETNGMTCIQAAASSGNMDLLEMILQLFGSQAGQEDVNLALQAAVKSGSTAGVQKLLDIGTDINTKQSEYSLLSEAIWQNDRDMFDFLLSKGADSDPLDTNATPLWAAVHEGHRYMAQRLIKAGADVNLPSFHRCPDTWRCYKSELKRMNQDFELETPVSAAVATGRADLVQMLVEAAADTNPSPPAIRPLLVAMMEFAVADAGGYTIAQLLLHHGANPNEVLPRDKIAALHQAIILGEDFEDNDMVGILVDYGADVNAPSDLGRPIQLMVQHRWGCKDLRTILNAGADVNASAVEGFPWTPLQRAIVKGKRPITDLLFKSGADIHAPAFWKEGITALQAAARRGEEGLVRDLISRGVDVNAPPARSGGATALQYATRLGDFNIARLLLENGANINAPPASERGATALQYAAMNGHLNIAILLLEEGALINAPASPVEGRTALQGAAEHGRLDMVHLLLENDEDPGLEERCRAAAEFAEREDHPVIAEKLRGMGKRDKSLEWPEMKHGGK